MSDFEGRMAAAENAAKNKDSPLEWNTYKYALSLARTDEERIRALDSLARMIDRGFRPERGLSALAWTIGLLSCIGGISVFATLAVVRMPAYPGSSFTEKHLIPEMAILAMSIAASGLLTAWLISRASAAMDYLASISVRTALAQLEARNR